MWRSGRCWLDWFYRPRVCSRKTRSLPVARRECRALLTASRISAACMSGRSRTAAIAAAAPPRFSITSKFAPFKPGGMPFFEPPTGDPRHDEPREFCMPAGFPSGMLSANAVQFVQNKNYLVIVHEFQRMTRIIPLDGRPAPHGNRADVFRRSGGTLGRRHAGD